MGYCYIIKVEFKDTWHSILSEKIADIATVERVEQPTYTAYYDTKNETFDGLSPLLAVGKIVCIKYNGGFFMFFGWVREGTMIIRHQYHRFTNKKKHKVVLKKSMRYLRKWQMKSAGDLLPLRFRRDIMYLFQERRI